MKTTDEPNVPYCGASWLFLLVFSIITLVALVRDGVSTSEASSYVKWAVSAVSISVGLSTLAVIASYVQKEKFSGTTIEGGLAFLLFALWAAAMPFLLDTNLALDEYDVIVNPNLYFFAWASFISVFMLWTHYMYIASSVEAQYFSLHVWALMCMGSFVVMVSAVRVYQSPETCNSDPQRHCRSTIFAIALGSFSALVSAFLWILGARMTAIVDTTMSIIMATAWVFGLIYITFGGYGNAPAPLPGNFYFATWICFMLALSAANTSIHAMISSSGNNEDKGDSPDEGMDTKGEEAIDEEDNLKKVQTEQDVQT